MKIPSLYTASLVLAIVALSVNTASATSCIYAGTFEVFAKKHPIIVRATVDSYGTLVPNRADVFRTMKVTVSETIKGAFPHATFQFFGDTGLSALRYITRYDFPIGSEHFFLLEDDDAIQPLMVCGEASVVIHGESIQGHRLGGNGYDVYVMGVVEFIQKIR